jgi:hypothetical protein
MASQLLTKPFKTSCEGRSHSYAITLSRISCWFISTALQLDQQEIRTNSSICWCAVALEGIMINPAVKKTPQERCDKRCINWRKKYSFWRPFKLATATFPQHSRPSTGVCYLVNSSKDLKAHINPVRWYWISLSVANADESEKLLTRHNENDRRRSILEMKYTNLCKFSWRIQEKLLGVNLPETLNNRTSGTPDHAVKRQS